MEAVANKPTVEFTLQGNFKIFTEAFTECGIGGRFSKFRRYSKGQWIYLHDLTTSTDSEFCYRIHDRVKRSSMEEISSMVARGLHDSPDWFSHLHTAQKVLNRVLDKGLDSDPSLTKYYHDEVNQSVYVANRMFIIEVGPRYFALPQVSTTAIFNYLEAAEFYPVEGRDIVTCHSEFDVVVVQVVNTVTGGKTTAITNLSAVDFETVYGNGDA